MVSRKISFGISLVFIFITKEVLECNSFEYSLKQGFLRSLMVNAEKLSLTSLESIVQEI